MAFKRKVGFLCPETFEPAQRNIIDETLLMVYENERNIICVISFDQLSCIITIQMMSQNIYIHSYRCHKKAKTCQFVEATSLAW